MHPASPPRSRLTRSPAPEPSPSSYDFITPTTPATPPLLPSEYIIPSSPSSTGAISHRSGMTSYALNASPIITPTKPPLRSVLKSRTQSPSPPPMPRHPLFAMIARQRWDYECMVARAQRRRERQRGVGAAERRRRREEMKVEMEWRREAGDESEKGVKGRKQKRVVSGGGVEVGRKKRALTEVAIREEAEVQMEGVDREEERQGIVGGASGYVLVE